MAHLIEYVTEYRWIDENADEPRRTEADEYRHDIESDEHDSDIVTIARDILVGAGATEPSSWPNWNHRTWYSAEPYTHPYTGVIEERTFHLHGFTADESRELYRRIVKR